MIAIASKYYYQQLIMREIRQKYFFEYFIISNEKEKFMWRIKMKKKNLCSEQTRSLKKKLTILREE